MKIKGETNKAISKDELDQPVEKADSLSVSACVTQKFIAFFNQNKRHWPLALIILITICLVALLSSSFIIESSFSSVKTFSKVSIFGINLGNLTLAQLNSKLNIIKSEFADKKILLKNSNKKWTFNTTDLGISFDDKATSKAVWQYNRASYIKKFRLLSGKDSSAISPVILINEQQCVKALSIINIPQVDFKDAYIKYDKGIKIISDYSGTRFDAPKTCRQLPKLVQSNANVADIYLGKMSANITKSDIQSKLSNIELMAGKPLSLVKGTYKLTLSPQQLLDMMIISKTKSEVQVGWSPGKLDKLISDISGSVNTNDDAPALGACQYLISVGGNWLDADATKKIFTDLATNHSRSYELTISHHDPAIGARTTLPNGNNGTVYLTYDDGLTFGNQIMDYAACYGIKVTFFELGSMVNNDVPVLKRAIAEGHAVQAHGYEHAATNYGQHRYDWQYNDISQSVNSIMNVTGVRPTYFRPPGGNKTDSTYTAASSNGLNLILWGVSSADTVADFGSTAICNNVVNGAFDGASVLMHSTKQKTAEALPCIAEGLSARGFNMQALR